MKWLVLAMIILKMNVCAAEELRFIDSTDDFGYFIDIDTVKLESDSVFSVNMVIIRVNVNQMEVVNMEINRAEKYYNIKWTKTLSYDERTEIKSDSRARGRKSYSDKSIMGDIVAMVLGNRE